MDLTAEQRVTPRGFLVLATEYLQSFKIINLEKPNIVTLLHVKYFLICHCIELVLKGELSLNGYPSSKLKSPLFGHNLDNLILELRKHKIHYSFLSAVVIKEINSYYKNKEFEYPLIGAKNLMPLGALQSIAEEGLSKLSSKLSTQQERK